ncbi:MAG: flagellar protein FlaG [Candidatus Polarisedimenticolaceae bacterium]|nr:flagellar protein FlaG [Candidatus Polarisedimenticolaceae bacterium]
MDILNKTGFHPESASLRPSTLSKPEGAAPVTRTESSINLNLSTERSSREEMSNAVRSLNESVQNIQRGIEFSIDEESGRSVVKVVDRETGDVIRQLPSEDALAVSRQIKEFVESRQHAGADSNSQTDEALGFIMRVQA